MYIYYSIIYIYVHALHIDNTYVHGYIHIDMYMRYIFVSKSLIHLAIFLAKYS